MNGAFSLRRWPDTSTEPAAAVLEDRSVPFHRSDGTFHDDDLNVIDEIQHYDTKLLRKQEQLHSLLALTETVAQLRNADGPKKKRLHTPLALIQLECLDRSIQVCLTRS